ncbi:MAG: hypothetical protein JJU33_11585 [Phycisphaerales bacterium]|nr:hypothetical protein [Phycisphaerales bacterium]
MGKKVLIAGLGVAAVLVCLLIANVAGSKADRLQVPYVPPELPEDAHPRFVSYIAEFRPVVVDPASIMPVEAQQQMAYINNVIAVRPRWEEDDIEELLDIIAAHESFREGRVDGEPMDIETRSSWGVLTKAFFAFRTRILFSGPMSDAAEARLIEALVGYATHDDVYFRSNSISIIMVSPRMMRKPEVRRVLRDAYHNDPSPRITGYIDQRMRSLRSRGRWEGEL